MKPQPLPKITNEAIARFWPKINKNGPIHPTNPELGSCWEWIAGSGENGYGLFSINGIMCRAHRVSYSIKHGTVPDGLCVLHSCDNPPCCNPAHLWLGTVTENNQDRERKGRSADNTGINCIAYSHPESIVRGERHRLSKLNESKVREIFKLNQAGISRKKLSKAFGVATSVVSLVLSRKAWKHVEL